MVERNVYDGRFAQRDEKPLDIRNGGRSAIFFLYPNPNRGNFILSFKAVTVTSRLVEIFDMTGRLISKETYKVISGKNEISFDLTAQPRGVYLLKTESYPAKIMVE